MPKARSRLGRRYPRSTEQFNGLSYPEKHDVKEELLTENFDRFKRSLRHQCIDDLGLDFCDLDSIHARGRQDGYRSAIQKLLLDLPRSGDYWWERLEKSLCARGQDELYFSLNPWERDAQYGASGASGAAPPPSPPANDSPSTENRSQDTNVQVLLAQLSSDPDLLRTVAQALTETRVANVQPRDVCQTAEMSLHPNPINSQGTSTLPSTSTEHLNAEKTPVCPNNLSAQLSPAHADAGELLSTRTEVFQPASGGQKFDFAMSELPDPTCPRNIVPGDDPEACVSLIENADQPIQSGSVAGNPSEVKPLNTECTPDIAQKLVEDQARALDGLSKSGVQSEEKSENKERETEPCLTQSQDALYADDLDPDGQRTEPPEADGPRCEDDACVAENLPPSSVTSGSPSPAVALQAAFSSQPEADRPQPAHAEQGRVETSEHQRPSIPSTVPPAPVHNTTKIYVYGDVKQLNAAQENTISKQMSLSRTDERSYGNENDLQPAQGTDEDQEEYFMGIPHLAQRRSFAARETELQSPPSPNSPASTEESVRYHAWDRGAQETAPKQIYTESEDEAVVPSASDPGRGELARSRASSSLSQSDDLGLWDDLQEDKHLETSPQLDYRSKMSYSTEATSAAAVTDTDDTARSCENLKGENSESMKNEDTCMQQDQQSARNGGTRNVFVTMFSILKEILSVLE